MSRIALINIDTQQSFHHRNYWQEDDIPAFQQAMLGLIEGCQARGILFASSAGCGFPETRS